ncbi:MAG: hypothetical protein H6822_23680 [Planctomycetaceae bacterium]|nr:hypothetical protein [Planctomycetales bacterium]MCB9925200.1 hypothetical protein [Planctomycetaceae bacterium]
MGYRNISLATRISTTLVGLLLIAAISNAVAIASAYRIEAFQETLVIENLSSVRAAEGLESALLEQRGYVSSYVLDRGRGDGLERLARKTVDFWLEKARETARTDTERELLDRLKVVQNAYAGRRERRSRRMCVDRFDESHDRAPLLARPSVKKLTEVSSL